MKEEILYCPETEAAVTVHVYVAAAAALLTNEDVPLGFPEDIQTPGVTTPPIVSVNVPVPVGVGNGDCGALPVTTAVKVILLPMLDEPVAVVNATEVEALETVTEFEIVGLGEEGK